MTNRHLLQPIHYPSTLSPKLDTQRRMWQKERTRVLQAYWTTWWTIAESEWGFGFRFELEAGYQSVRCHSNDQRWGEIHISITSCIYTTIRANRRCACNQGLEIALPVQNLLASMDRDVDPSCYLLSISELWCRAWHSMATVCLGHRRTSTQVATTSTVRDSLPSTKIARILLTSDVVFKALWIIAYEAVVQKKEPLQRYLEVVSFESDDRAMLLRWLGLGLHNYHLYRVWTLYHIMMVESGESEKVPE